MRRRAAHSARGPGHENDAARDGPAELGKTRHEYELLPFLVRLDSAGVSKLFWSGRRELNPRPHVNLGCLGETLQALGPKIEPRNGYHGVTTRNPIARQQDPDSRAF
jgi:hypothetical protein